MCVSELCFLMGEETVLTKCREFSHDQLKRVIVYDSFKSNLQLENLPKPGSHLGTSLNWLKHKKN